ncbi:MAG: NHL repeat-containing protein, partial [Chloroflexota bacterium]
APGTPITPTTILGGADAASTLLAPQEAVHGSDGLIYVADTGNHRVAVLNGHGKLVRSITKSAHGLLSAPSSLAFTPDGHLVVLDSDTGFVLEYTMKGKLVAGSSRSVPLVHARGLAVDAQGRIYVADPATDSIFTLDSGLNIVHQETASPDGGKTFLFQQPTAVAPAPGGGMYVVDGQIGALDLFSADWQLQHTWPLAITDTLHSPRVLPLADGRVLVTDPADNKLLLFTPGVVQPAFYALNTVPGPLAAPLGIAWTTKHRLLLTCTGANQLWVVTIPGVA